MQLNVAGICQLTCRDGERLGPGTGCQENVIDSIGNQLGQQVRGKLLSGNRLSCLLGRRQLFAVLFIFEALGQIAQEFRIIVWCPFGPWTSLVRRTWHFICPERASKREI